MQSNPAEYYAFVNMILLCVLGGVLSLMVGLLGWWASNVNAQLKDIVDNKLKDINNDMHGQFKIINEELHDQSTCLAIMDKWTVAHDAKDDERHEGNTVRLDRNHQSIHEIRNQLSNIGIKRIIHDRERD